MADKIQSIPYTFEFPVTLIFPRLFEAQAFKNSQDGKKSFSMSVGIAADHPDFAKFWGVVTQAAMLKWPGLNLQDPTQVAQIKWPIIGGADKANMLDRAAQLEGKTKDTAAYRNYAWIRSTKSSEKSQPTVAVDVPGRGTVDITPTNLSELRKFVYGGALALIKVALWPSNVPSGPLAGNYVSAFIQAVRVVADPTTGVLAPQIAAFNGGGGQAASGVFANYKGHVSNVSPTAGLPGAGHPFAPGGIGNPGPQTF